METVLSNELNTIIRGEMSMKTIGLIGGMSWESSIIYYRIINELVREKLGGMHSCKSLMYSTDFAEIEKLQHQGKWDKLAEMMINISLNLKNAGADCIVVCTNTMHKLADAVENTIDIPLIHIADATAKPILKQGLKKVGLLGTKFTMEEDFYKGRLTSKHNIEVIIPEPDEREIIHSVIYQELVIGKIADSSREKYNKIIEGMYRNGAEGIILGCTEIALLVHEKDSHIPLFDTTQIHAQAAVEFSLKA
ncbi:MAG: aspartate racemase [Firmicutes bacterium]|nr:aspartate racemase [Bacillota bacterium]